MRQLHKCAYLWKYLESCLLAGADLDVTPLHKTLLDALNGKKVFLLSTNAYGHSGFEEMMY